MTIRSPNRRRRWYQFNLRTLLIGVLLVSLPLSWFACRVQEARKEREAVEALRDVGVAVVYDYQLSDGHVSVPDNLGNADMYGIGSNDLAEPPGPPWLRRLLGDNFFANAVYVILLRGTDTDLAHVTAFTHLEALELCDSEVTDSGIIQLVECPELRYLGIRHTKVTPGGVKKLQEALPNCQILY